MIFRDVFEDPDITIDDSMTAADIPGWDSFNHINLIMRIEEEFNIAFTTKEIGEMGSVKNLIELVEQKTT